MDVDLLQPAALQPDVVLAAAAAGDHQATHLIACNVLSSVRLLGFTNISPYKSNCPSGLGPQTVFS